MEGRVWAAKSALFSPFAPKTAQASDRWRRAAKDALFARNAQILLCSPERQTRLALLVVALGRPQVPCTSGLCVDECIGPEVETGVKMGDPNLDFEVPQAPVAG